MKIRTGFVTNSSSTSYIVVFEVTGTDDQIKENFGKFGEDIVKDYVYTDINKMVEDIAEWEYWDDDLADSKCNSCKEPDEACDICNPDDVTPEDLLKYFEDRYCTLEKGKRYFAGHACQGYGGDYDVQDDRAVTLGYLLQSYGMAETLYVGDPW